MPLKRLNRLIEYSIATLGLGMALLVATQVFCRYILNASLFWSEELARYMLVWLTFLGATVAYYRGLHPGIDLFTGRLPARARKVCAVGAGMASCLLFTIMVVAGLRFTWFIRTQISAALHLPKWLVLSIIPLAGLILLLYALSDLIALCRRSKNER